MLVPGVTSYISTMVECLVIAGDACRGRIGGVAQHEVFCRDQEDNDLA